MARELDGDKSNLRRTIAALRRLELVTPIGSFGAYERIPLRVTARGRIAMGLPLVVYLAWPLPPPGAADVAQELARAAGLELARWVLDVIPGATPISPYMAPVLARDRSVVDAAAVQLASSSDAVIVWRDPLLLGRPDVAAAMLARAETTLIDQSAQGEIAAGASAWSKPWIVTPHDSSPQRRPGA